MPRRLLLVGGGHAHLFVLEYLARQGLGGLAVQLISPSPLQHYSGMLPGWMAGLYRLAQCQIDLRPLLQAAGVSFIQARVVAMDADQRRVMLSDGRTLDYELLSLDVGSETQCARLAEAGERLIPVKPLPEFAQAWPATLAIAACMPSFHLAVVGGGAAGVELALSAARALRAVNAASRVSLLTGERGPLQGHSGMAVRLAQAMLAQAGVAVHRQRAEGVPEGLRLGDGQLLAADRVLAATGPQPASWLQGSALRLDRAGFVAVNGQHQSLSHADVFAAGDVCARADRPMSRSGVHAVKAGPVLAHNLMAQAAGRALKTYWPRRHSLYLLADGQRQAMMSWGPLALRGAWVWRWKDAIDRRFMARWS